MSNPLVHILVLNYNGAIDTIECVKSLNNIKYDNYKIIVIDNKSTDNSLEILEKYKSNYILIKSEHNLGYAGGNNIGIRYALENNADYVLILNNDTIVEESFLNKMMEACKENNILVASPKVYFYDSKLINSFGAKKDFLERVKNIGENDIDSIKYSENIFVKYIMGCCMLINTKVIEEVGMFDEKFFMYLEETDLCKRISEKFKIMVCADSKIYHKCGASTKTNSKINYFTEYYFRRNLLYYLKKNCNILKRIFIMTLILVKDIITVVKNFKDKRFRRVLILAWKDYLLNKMYQRVDLFEVIN